VDQRPTVLFWLSVVDKLRIVLLLQFLKRISRQILPTVLPLRDLGGNCSGIVVLRLDLFVILELRLLDLFVILELRLVSLSVVFFVTLPVWVKLEDVGVIDAPGKSLVTEDVVPPVLLEGNSNPETI
jgi:hypothetical protein